jgi:hypothetical protein
MESEKNGNLRLALIDPVDRVEHHPDAGTVAPAAELLRDEGELAAGSVQPGDDGSLDGPVDRRRVVAAHPGAQHRLPVGAVRQLGQDGAHVFHRQAAGREPAIQAA